MDITLISIGASAIIILVVLIIGFKKTIGVLEKTKQKQNEIEKSLQSSLDNTSENIKSLISEEIQNVKQEVLNQSELFSKTISDVDTKTNKNFSNLLSIFKEEIEKSTSKNESSIESLADRLDVIVKNISNASSTVNSKVEKVLELQDKNAINAEVKLDSTFTNLVHIVNNLRLDNLINVSNEISKYKEGVYEDEHFLQEVGHCKIIKLTDKNNGEITNVYYDENGNKSYTETLSNDKLKYKMQYENGKLLSGAELNDDGDIVFEYFYDDAEEVSRKIEYIYDQSKQLQEKLETKY